MFVTVATGREERYRQVLVNPLKAVTLTEQIWLFSAHRDAALWKPWDADDLNSSLYPYGFSKVLVL